ncbi:MAG: peptidylprolyl isomerase [Bacteroidota bacterium]
MTRMFILGVPLFVAVLFIGCGASNPILATIGDEKITLRSFEDNFVKNNGGWDTSAATSFEDRQKFLDLLVKFKLKVKEARAQGLEKDSAIVSEMDSYNTSVAQSYMIEKEVVEPGVQKFYDRKKEEIRASHILFRLQRNATPEDTLMAYIRAVNAIDQIPYTPFDSLASRYSEDPSVKSNHGDLGFFTSDRMVPEFGDACFLLKPGEYTKRPIRTQYGYHVIKVTARRPNSGSVRISHILLRFNESSSDTAAVRDTVWMLYKRLKSGARFKEVMQKYSQDPQSVANNGDIGFYERDRIPPAVADVFYQLQIDSISEPMRFNYGYHIFKLTEKKALPSFVEMQKDLKNQYQQVRYQYDYKNYVEKLKAQYRVLIDSTVVNMLISKLDTTKTAGNENWKDTLSTEMLKTTLIHCTGRPFKVKDFADKVITTNEYKSYRLTPVNVWVLVTKLVDVVALEQHARHAAERHPVLAQLLQEYEEGTLLYRIEQDEVWKKIMVNDSLLREYYNAHMENYRWPERVNFAEIYTKTDSMAKAAYKKVKSGKDFMGVAQEYTNRLGYQEKKGVWGFQLFTFNDLSLKASTMAIDSVTAPFKFETGWSIIKALGRDSAHVKTFEEAIPEVASAYQEVASKQREQEWIEALKKKYPVTINKEALTEAFKRKRIESQ